MLAQPPANLVGYITRHRDCFALLLIHISEQRRIANRDENVTCSSLGPSNYNSKYASRNRFYYHQDIRPYRQWSQQSDVPEEICVEGNIGWGKSTLLSGLKKAGMLIFQEPVETRWREHLKTLYRNKARWGFTSQIKVLEWFTHISSLVSDITMNRTATSLITPVMVRTLWLHTIFLPKICGEVVTSIHLKWTS